MTDRVHLIAERIWGLVTVLALGLALYDIATRCLLYTSDAADE